MTSPERIQRRRAKGWRMPEGAVYVGRPSRWGNPFRIYHGHSLIGPPWSAARASWTHLNADDCVNAYVTASDMCAAYAVSAYRDLMNVRLRDEPDRMQAWINPLRGRDLACWCPIGQPCHADVLLQIANGSIQ